jgi:epoxyqueuosine reductase
LTAPAQLADELRRIGREAGLESVGICGTEAFTRARDTIEANKSRGLHAGMQFTYRAPEKSTDPSRLVPDAKSLVVGARSYLRRPSSEPGPARARVARYSWSDEYRPLKLALGVIARRLRAEGWRARVLADDNALVDRAAAVRAGLGWYGKNTNVLLPGRGSWFILGSVATDAPIAPLIPVAEVPDGCGTCRRCTIDCPTGALDEPGTLDARKCLAWLLQVPGPFPLEHRVALGDRIYGCDECQERCPVNRKGDPPDSARAAGEGAQDSLDVLWMLTASDEDLMGAIGRWYIPGRDPRYVRRNALVVLGNIGAGRDPEVRRVLGIYLAGDDELLREHAAWATDRLAER